MSRDIPLVRRLWGALLKPFPVPAKMTGPSAERLEPCRMCGCGEGFKISEVHYWDIKECNLITCPRCNLTQFDPMLTDEETALGCYAYYIQETMAEPPHNQLRNCVRNYRRGVA